MHCRLPVSLSTHLHIHCHQHGGWLSGMGGFELKPACVVLLIVSDTKYNPVVNPQIRKARECQQTEETFSQILVVYTLYCFQFTAMIKKL